MKNKTIFFLSILGAIFNSLIIANKIYSFITIEKIVLKWFFLIVIVLLILTPILFTFKKINPKNAYINILGGLAISSSILSNGVIFLLGISSLVKLPLFVCITITLLTLTIIPILSYYIHNQE